MGALMPGVSMAVSHLRGDANWQDICSASKPSNPSPGPASLDMLTTGHCAACHLHAPALALPPVMEVMPVRIDLAFEMPERFFSASVTAHAWRAAPARAPPVNV